MSSTPSLCSFVLPSRTKASHVYLTNPPTGLPTHLHERSAKRARRGQKTQLASALLFQLHLQLPASPSPLLPPPTTTTLRLPFLTMPPPSAPKTNGIASDKKPSKPSRNQLKREKKKAKKASAGTEVEGSTTGAETETESEMESELEVSQEET